MDMVLDCIIWASVPTYFNADAYSRCFYIPHLRQTFLEASKVKHRSTGKSKRLLSIIIRYLVLPRSYPVLSWMLSLKVVRGTGYILPQEWSSRVLSRVKMKYTDWNVDKTRQSDLTERHLAESCQGTLDLLPMHSRIRRNASWHENALATVHFDL